MLIVSAVNGLYVLVTVDFLLGKNGELKCYLRPGHIKFALMSHCGSTTLSCLIRCVHAALLCPSRVCQPMPS